MSADLSVEGNAGAPPYEVVVGVDVGTTAAKVSAFGLGAPWRHTAVPPHATRRCLRRCFSSPTGLSASPRGSASCSA